MPAKSEKRYIKNIMADTAAKISIVWREDDSAMVYGYAVQAATTVRVDNTHRHQHKAASRATIDETIQYVVSAIVSELRANQSATNTAGHSAGQDGLYSAAYTACNDPQRLCNPSWAESTARNALNYFRRQILPRLDDLGADACDVDLDEIKEALIAKALKSGRSNRDPTQAEQSVAKYLYQANYLYRALRTQNPNLPELEFAVTPRNTVLREQAKSIPNATRVKLAALLCRFGEKSGAALGVAMMLLCGLRTAEAAAVHIGDIAMRNGYVVYPVLYQHRSGQRVATLKTDAGYRVVVGPYLLQHLLQQRIRFLTGLGYSDGDIRQMPLVAKDDDPHAYLGSNALSAWGRALLLSAGYTTDTLQAAEALQMAEPDLDKTGKASRDVMAYILRRDWCSRACNVCGLSADTVDYLMGHVREHGTFGADYTSVEIQEDVAKKLENYVFLPGHSLNPAFLPVSVKSGARGDLAPATSHILKNNSTVPLRITLDLHSCEPGVEIAVAATGILKVSKKRGGFDSPNQRQCRVPIGKVFPQSYYDELEKCAKDIDLTI